jgi:hypothetical protein
MAPQLLHFDNFTSYEKGTYGEGLGLAITRWMLHNEPSLFIPGYKNEEVTVENGEAGIFAVDGDTIYYADSNNQFPSDDYYYNKIPKWDVDAKIKMIYAIDTEDHDMPKKRIRKNFFIEFKTGKNAKKEREQRPVMEAVSHNPSAKICRENPYEVLSCDIRPDPDAKKMHVSFFLFFQQGVLALDPSV